MSKILHISAWRDAASAKPADEPLMGDLFEPEGFLAALNAVAITGPQMRSAIEAIAHLPVRSPADIAAHAKLLQTFAADYGFVPPAPAPAALHARAIAMDQWCQTYDPFGDSDVDAFYDAGARARLVDTGAGIGFEPESFGELVAFIAEIPW